MGSGKWTGRALCVWMLCGCVLSAARPESVRLWAGGALEYEVDSAAVVYPGAGAAAARHAGWRLRARLGLLPRACADDEALLQLEVRSPTVEVVGGPAHAAAAPSLWDAPAGRAAFYVHWRAGAVHALLLPAAADTRLRDHMRALATLLHFQIMDGERNETDSSGDCSVLYETLSPLEFRKLKRSCVWRGADEGGARSRRVTRYTMNDKLDTLTAITAEDEHRLEAGPGTGANVTARGWARLRLAGSERGSCPRAQPGLADELEKLRARADLKEVDLPLEGSEEATTDSTVEQPDWSSLISAGNAGGGGTRGHARHVLTALTYVRGADKKELLRLLKAQEDEAALIEVARILGAAGTKAAHEAAVAGLPLQLKEPGSPAAIAYLASLGGANNVPASVIRDVLRLADSRDVTLAAASLLAAAAACADDTHAVDTCNTVRDATVKRLTRCHDDECRATAILALGNLARPDTAELLIQNAETTSGEAALAAIRALSRLPRESLPAARRRRLLHVAEDPYRALEVRAAALDLAVVSSTHAPLPLAITARRLLREKSSAASELRRLLWTRLSSLEEHEPVREFIRAANVDPELGSWHAKAAGGTSGVVARGVDQVELDAVTVASMALLRDAAVTLRLHSGAGPAHVLTVRIWTRGLHSLAGTAGEGAGDEDAAAGLQLAVAGADLPPVTLFSGQAALLGHVWAGTGSSDTLVLRAAAPLPAHTVRLPLGAAGCTVRLRAAAAGVLALDARAALSLWARTGRARLTLRAAGAAAATAALATAAAHSAAAADAQLVVAADLDFYSAVALCVRASLPPHELERHDTSRTAGRARYRTELRQYAGRALALGRENDAVCRTLAAGDDDDTQR